MTKIETKQYFQVDSTCLDARYFSSAKNVQNTGRTYNTQTK